MSGFDNYYPVYISLLVPARCLFGGGEPVMPKCIASYGDEAVHLARHIVHTA